MKQLALIAMVACLLLPSGLMAQFERAAVLGTVQDSTGAVAPGVAVTLTNVQTGIAQAAVTGTTGNFQFLNVAIGQSPPIPRSHSAIWGATSPVRAASGKPIWVSRSLLGNRSWESQLTSQSIK